MKDINEDVELILFDATKFNKSLNAYKKGCMGVERIESTFLSKTKEGLLSYSYKVFFENGKAKQIKNPLYVEIN